MYKRILTIQDISAVGQCSLTVALPLISACGIECAILPGALLSNHTGTGFSSWSILDLTDEMGRIESEWKKNGLRFDAFYTGYVCATQIDRILSIFESSAAPGALRIVDPAMADNGKLYPGFADDFPKQMARLCKNADYILPNLTEAALLVGREPKLENYDRRFVEDLMRELRDTTGAKNVLLTGVSFDVNLLGTALLENDSITYDFNTKNARMSHGTGDVFASVFTGALMRGKSAAQAAAIAADFVCSAIEATPEEHVYGVAFEKVIVKLASALA